MIGKFPAILTLNQLFLKLNQFIYNQLPVLPDLWHWFTRVGCILGSFLEWEFQFVPKKRGVVAASPPLPPPGMQVSTHKREKYHLW